MKRNLLAGVIAALFVSGASAFEPFVVKDIRVEGIQRTEAGTVFSYLPVKVGETMTDDKAAAAIKALFATGFFKDVRIEIDGGVLLVVLEERPAIAQIDFVGMKEFEKDPVLKSLREIGFAVSRSFDRSMLERAEQELKRQYLTRGRYSAQITTTVTPQYESFSFDEDAPVIQAALAALRGMGAEAQVNGGVLQLQNANSLGGLTIRLAGSSISSTPESLLSMPVSSVTS